jgi:hypothetical protein
MPEPMLFLEDVRITVLGGAVLPAHASGLVLNSTFWAARPRARPSSSPTRRARRPSC